MKALPALLLPLLFASAAFAEVSVPSNEARPAAAEAPAFNRLGGRERGIQFAAGAAATLVTVPAGMLLGGALGSLSNSYVSVAPWALLTWLVLPAAGAALAEWWMGNKLLAGSTHLQPAAWVALGANLVLMVAAIAGGLNAHNPLHLSLFSLASALVIPGALTGALKVWDDAGIPSPAAPPAALLETGRPRPSFVATATLLEVPL